MISSIILIALGLLTLITIVNVLSGGKLFKAWSNRSKASAEEFAESQRNPVADGQVALATAEKELGDMKTMRVELRTDIAEETGNLGILKDKVKTWEDVAKAAGGKNDREGVRRALAEKKGYEEEASLLESHLSELQSDLAELSGDIEAREIEIDEARRSHKHLSHIVNFETMRQKRLNAKLNKDQLADTSASLSQLGADAARLRARTTALQQEAHEGNDLEDLEKQYLGTTGGVSDEDIDAYLPKETAAPSA